MELPTTVRTPTTLRSAGLGAATSDIAKKRLRLARTSRARRLVSRRMNGANVRPNSGLFSQSSLVTKDSIAAFVATGADPAHRPGEVVVLQGPDKCLASKWRSPIRMNYQRPDRTTKGSGVAQGRDGQVDGHPISEAVAAY